MARPKPLPARRRSGPGELMPRGRRHTPGPGNSCSACGEPFPCAAIPGAREFSARVMPTATVRARDLEHQLRALREALRAFEHDRRDPARRDPREPHRPALVAVALEHVQQAMDALEMAGRDEPDSGRST